ncbi:glycoside hydrolase family 10 protein [Nannocystaceae bacterium ST9]
MLRRPSILLVGLLVACSEGSGVDEDPSSFDDEIGSESDSSSDEGPDLPDGESSESETDTSGGPMQELTEVGHAREFRGVWVATVYNINWPSSAGLSPAEGQAELLAILDTMAAIHLNAVVFQVRPESDAFYPSTLEPWSRYMQGTQGEDPGWDPLDFLCREAHARNIEVHAWLNPYRAAASSGAQLAPPHIALQAPEHAHVYNGGLWMDPGALEVREHTVDVALDIVGKYPIDGIHLDDYFYPYPDGNEFPDSLTWNDYLAEGGALAKADWRRDNVNALVEELHDSIAASDPDVRFGIAPFGIYRPGIPAGIVGFDQYTSLFADPKLWLEQGWVDYLAPQLYWPTTYVQQDYEVLLEWWTTVAPERYVFAGNYLSKLGTAPEWSLDELLLQVEISRMYADANSLGNVFFQVEPLLSNTLGIDDALLESFYAAPALTPPLADRLDEIVEPPLVAVEGTSVTLSDPAEQRLRAFVVYADDGMGGWPIDRIVPAATTQFELPPGRWAISAAGWHNVESLGVVIEI